MKTNRPLLIFSAILAAALLSAAGLVAVSAGAAWRAAPTSQGTLWGANARANGDISGTQTSQHEPSLAISRVDPNIVVVAAKDYRDGVKHVYLYVSQDGGQTWPPALQRRLPNLPADISEESDPVVTARDDGRIYVTALGYGSGHGLFTTWSDDGGNNWSDAVAITHNQTPPGWLDDKEWMAVDNFPASPYYHNLYVAWANGGILFKRSTDGGTSWTINYQIIAPGATEYPYVVVATDGDVYVFYMYNWGPCANGVIRFVKSSDGGATFGAPVNVANASQPCSPIHGGLGYDQYRFFSIITAAANPLDPDELWVAWTDDNNVTYGPTDVLYVRSTDGGTSWSSPARLSHDAPGTGRDHITPVFAAGPDGRLHALWLDKRYDPQNHLYHAYHTSTADGGQTWEPDHRVSEQAFDLNLYFPPPSGYNAAGDYWGLDAAGNIVMAAWNTTVETSQDIYVARGVISDIVPMTVTLRGMVSDAATLLPIDGANVTVDAGSVATSTASGAYTLTLPAGVYSVTASAAGYLPQEIGAVTLVSGTVALDFALEPAFCPDPSIGAVISETSGLTVTFTAQVTATYALSFLWDFGDGVTSTLAAPVHVYSDYGAYTAALQVNDYCGQAQWSGGVQLPAPPKKIYLPLVRAR